MCVHSTNWKVNYLWEHLYLKIRFGLGSSELFYGRVENVLLTLNKIIHFEFNVIVFLLGPAMPNDHIFRLWKNSKSINKNLFEKSWR